MTNSDYSPPVPPQGLSWVSRHKKTLIAVAAVIAALILVGHATAGPQGFHNMSTLQSSVRSQVLTHGWPAGATVLCVPDSQGAQCLVKGGGASESLSIVIAPNGNSWVSS